MTWKHHHLAAVHEKDAGGQPRHLLLPLHPLYRQSTSSRRRRSSLNAKDSEIVLPLQNAANENCSGSTSWTRRSATWKARTSSWPTWSSGSRTQYATSSKKFLNTWRTVVKSALWKKQILPPHENPIITKPVLNIYEEYKFFPKETKTIDRQYC